jgi:hypothetical protein
MPSGVLKIKITVCYLLGILFFLHSCTLEKRRYSGGYHVTRKSTAAPKNFAAKTSSQKNTISLTEIKHSIELAALKEKEAKKTITVSAEKKKLHTFFFKPVVLSVPGDTCDTLILKNGAEIKANVFEISQKLVRYKHCDNPTGPTFNIETSEVSMIKFKNGTSQEFNEEPEKKALPRNAGVGGAPSASLEMEQLKVKKKANATLAWAIFAFPLVIIYLLGVVCAIVAIENAVSLKKWMRKNPELYSESANRMANAGMILGIILLSLLVITIFILIGIATGTFLLWI